MDQDPFAALRARFVARCGDDLVALRAAADGNLPFAEVGALAHRIAGGAGTFGFAVPGACAYRTETLLLEGAPEAEIRASLAALIVSLEALTAGMGAA